MDFVEEQGRRGRDHQAPHAASTRPARSSRRSSRSTTRSCSSSSGCARSRRSSASFIDSIAAIAAGAIGAAANRSSRRWPACSRWSSASSPGSPASARSATSSLDVVKKIRAPIDKALDCVVDWIVKLGKALLARAAAGGQGLVEGEQVLHHQVRRAAHGRDQGRRAPRRASWWSAARSTPLDDLRHQPPVSTEPTVAAERAEVVATLARSIDMKNAGDTHQTRPARRLAPRASRSSSTPGRAPGEDHVGVATALPAPTPAGLRRASHRRASACRRASR